jgi:hypothetical protein
MALDCRFTLGLRVRSGVPLRMGLRVDWTRQPRTYDSAEEARRRGLLPLCAEPDVPRFHQRRIGLWIVFGQANLVAFAIAFAVVLGVALFVVLYEEPTLRRKFAAEYEEYCRNVPRWIPRQHPWNPRRCTQAHRSASAAKLSETSRGRLSSLSG